MTKAQIKSITKDRLDGWTEKCVKIGCVPILLIGVGQCPEAPPTNLIIPHGISLHDIKTILADTLIKIEAELNRNN